MKDKHTDGKQMARCGRKMAIYESVLFRTEDSKKSANKDAIVMLVSKIFVSIFLDFLLLVLF